MKKLLGILVLGLLFSFNVFAETYTCSHELSRFDRPGEVETSILKKNGKRFIHDEGWEFKIIGETEEVLLLLDYGLDLKFIHTIIIDKNTKEFTEKYLTIKNAKKYETRPQVYGKCVLTLN